MEPKGLHSPENPSEAEHLHSLSSDLLLESESISFAQPPSAPMMTRTSAHTSSVSALIDPLPAMSASSASSAPSSSISTRPRALTHAADSSSLPHPPVSFFRGRSATISNPQKINTPSAANVSSTSPSTSTSTATSPTTTTAVTNTASTPGTSASASTSTTSSSASTHHPSEGREKRKRSRVTPEQLSHLERLFAMDRSPTAAKRKEISELLGMQERQTQIWFQNRRAKAKTLEGKSKLGFRDSPHSGGDSPPPGTPSEYIHPPLDIDLNSLIHEDDPTVTFLPCTDLTIGSWRRISATFGQHDLLAYVSYVKQCFMWFIYSNGYGFKMEIPFDSITNTTFNNTAVGQGIASFYLSRPPVFYLEATVSPTAGTDNNDSHAPTLSPISPQTGSVISKLWKKCADWTEGQQASKVLRHDLVGAPGPLMTALKSLHSQPPLSLLSTSSSVPSAVPPPITTAMPMMHIPQPPLTTIDTTTTTTATSTATAPFGFHINAAHLAHGRKRSSSGPPNYSLLGTGSPDDFSSPSDSHHSSFGPSSSRSLTYTNPYPHSHPPVSFFRSFPSSVAATSSTSVNASSSSAPPFSHSHPHISPTSSTTMGISSPISDYTTVPISHVIAPRPYSASSSMTDPRLRYASSSSISYDQHHSHIHYPQHHTQPPTPSSSSVPTFRNPAGSSFRSDSPPLLTAAFDPSTLHRGMTSLVPSGTIIDHQMSHHLTDMDPDMTSGSNVPTDNSMLPQMDMDMTDTEAMQFTSGIS